jgi:hypothetical protein
MGSDISLLLAKDFFCKPLTWSGFSGVRNSYFYLDLCKASLAAICFIRLTTKLALTSTPMLFVKARAAAEKLLSLIMPTLCC